MNSLGTDVIFQSDISNNPRCIHGPTLLFKKFVKDEKKSGRRFYACSACRDRKECQFFQWEDEKMSQCRKMHWENALKKLQKKFPHKNCVKIMKQFLKLNNSERKFCKTCSYLILPNEYKDHLQHNVCYVKEEELQRPSFLLSPFQNNKKEAQFFFTEDTTKFLIELTKLLCFKKVLCIGTPRIHEYIYFKEQPNLISLLLDLDERYKVFYNQEAFCHFNMFNNYFFNGEESEKIFCNYLNSKEIIVFIDPPFGGHIDALMQTLKNISQKWKTLTLSNTEIPVVVFHPYFMEPRLTEALPSLVMMDYKVQYTNHPSFHNNKKGRKLGSPVRIFTNIEPRLFKLPEEGYKYCKICQKYVAKENKHCFKCNACTSKDGRPYKHCAICERCVKETYVHCNECKICTLISHKCELVQKKSGCHICGSSDHKRKDCLKNKDFNRENQYHNLNQFKRRKVDMSVQEVQNLSINVPSNRKDNMNKKLRKKKINQKV